MSAGKTLPLFPPDHGARFIEGPGEILAGLGGG